MITIPVRWLFEWGKLIFSCLLIVGYLASCENDQPEPVDNLNVDRFEPLAALPGDTITIYGMGFDIEAVRNVVQFSSTKTASEIPLAKIISSSETEMQAIVPPFTETGLVKVAVGQFSTLSQAPFLLSPSISVVEPEAAKAGEQVTVGGQNFTSDTATLVLFVGNVRIDSIFGTSNSQVAFPLPFNIPSGETTIRLGIKIQGDTVFAPPIRFVVLDTETPELIRFDPDDTGTPGTKVTLVGANFNPDETTVKFGDITIELTEFLHITNEEIVLRVPASLQPGQAGVMVTTKKANGESATTDPLTFTVLKVEPVFYWSFGDRSGVGEAGVQRFEGGQKTSLGDPLKNAATYGGIALSSDKGAVYTLRNATSDYAEIFKATPLNFENPDTKAVNVAGAEAFPSLAEVTFYNDKLYLSRAIWSDRGIWTFDLLKPANKTLIKLYDLKIPYDGDYNILAHAANIKISGSFLYWTESFEAETVVVRADLSNPAANPGIIFSNTTHPGKLTAVLAIAIDGNNIYIVNSPHDNGYTGIVTENSTIFKGNLNNPPAALEELHKGNVGKITDIEFYNGMLYYMNYTEDNTGGIFKISPTTGSLPEPVVEAITHGAYFDFERD